MRIVFDTRQQAGKHDTKHDWLTAHGYELVRRKLDFGDYALDVENPTLSIDTKQNIAEVAQNMTVGHARFNRECDRAAAAGARLVVLVENTDGYLSLDDVSRWVNSHCRKCVLYWKRKCDPNETGKCNNPKHKKSAVKPIQGARLARTMLHVSQDHGCEWLFCKPSEAGAVIAALLEKEVKNG